MTKRDLVDKIHTNTGLTKDEAFAYLETVLETIKKTLETAETSLDIEFVNDIVN